MTSSWPEFWDCCKSSLSAIGRECFLGRAKWRERARGLHRLISKLEERVKALDAENQLLKETLKKLEAERAEQKVKPSASAPSSKPDGVKPSGCQYSASEMSLAVNLARKIGLRPTVSVLHVLYKWLNVNYRIPTYQTIESWMLRIGLDRTERAKKVEGSTWMVDHTCQTGKEKVLTILRVRSSSSLDKQQPLKLADMDLLAEVCRDTWTHTDVLNVLNETAQKYGAPGAILADQASNLQKPALAYKNTAKDVLVLTDFKHFLANQFKLMLEADKNFSKFTKQLQRTCASVQQTELSHFVPRPMKRKARFMNLGAVLQWARATLWHLEHLQSQSRATISQERMEEKFGWIRSLESQIDHWQQCQCVIDAGVNLVNRQGLSQSTADEFVRLVTPLAGCAQSRKLVRQAIKFLKSQAAALKKGQQVPLSTEVIESVFASFKALEKQHSKEGFSSILLALGTLLRPVTEKEVLRSFARTKCQDVAHWIKTNLGHTYTSKRQAMFREYRQSLADSAPNSAIGIAA